MSELVVKVEKLSHSYSSNEVNFNVIDEINFDLDRGQILGVLGPSGCGKSTMLKCIAGVLKPTRGKISICGFTPQKAKNQKIIGIALQENSLLDWLTVKENIMLPMKIGKDSTKAGVSYDELIKIIGLQEFENYHPIKLSGGMKQRVIMARALITSPQLLLLDEPFSAIDLLTRTKLMVEFHRIIKKLNVTTIMITHSVEEAVFMSDKLLILEKIPTKIRKNIPINFENKRDLSLYENIIYTNKVNECRKLLMNEVTINYEQSNFNTA